MTYADYSVGTVFPEPGSVCAQLGTGEILQLRAEEKDTHSGRQARARAMNSSLE